MMIDWTLFAERVPLNTRVRANREAIYLDLLGSYEMTQGEEGILVRYGRETTEEFVIKTLREEDYFVPLETWADGAVVQFYSCLHELRIVHYHLEYFIDGRWLTSKEVMI